MNDDTDDDAFDAWLDALDKDVVQGEYGYERGEFTVYPTLWRDLYDRGLSPSDAFAEALKDHAKAHHTDVFS